MTVIYKTEVLEIKNIGKKRKGYANEGDRFYQKNR